MITLAARFHESAIDDLSQKGYSYEIGAANPHTEILVIRSQQKVDRPLLRELDKLKLVLTTTSGFDHIDLQACKENGVAVCHTPLAAKDSVAELALFFAIGCLRNFNLCQNSIADGSFRSFVDIGRTLSECTWGIIGVGHTGGRVQDIVRPLTRDVLLCDPHKQEAQHTFHETLAQADIISLHVPLDSTTRHMINQQTLLLMKSDAFLLNLSRGQVVDETALIEAVDTGQIGGAALDVFETEPLPPSSPLIGHPKILTSPHIGAFCQKTFLLASTQAIETIDCFFSKKTLPHRLV